MSVPTGVITRTKRSTPRKLRPLKRLVKSAIGQTNVVKDTDAGPLVALNTGTLNQTVQRATAMRMSLSGSTEGFFKARDVPGDDVQALRLGNSTSEFAVASSRLARALGLGTLITRNKWGKINGVFGVFSAKAPGDPLEKDSPGGRLFQNVDYRREGRIQKGLFDLQLFDSITGQVDRNAGNIFIDRATGKVTGIDDDASFLTPNAAIDDLHPGGTNPGPPDFVDEGTAQKVLALNANDLPGIFKRTGDPFPLPKEAIELAQQRLAAIQDHIRDLKRNGRLIKTSQWGQGLYAQLTAGPDNYLLRAATRLQQAVHNAVGAPPTF